MDGKTTNQNLLPSEKLTKKYAELRAQGLEDMKFWVRQDKTEVSVEDVASEVLSIVELYETRNYEVITDTIDKRDE